MIRTKKGLIQLVVSIALLAGLLYFVDIAETVDALRNADVGLLLLALIMITANRILMPLKWALLLRVKNIREPLPSVVKIYYVSSFLGLYLPPTVGTDIIRAYYIAKRGFSLKDCISAILVERLLGLIAVLIFALIGIGLFLVYFSQVQIEGHTLLLVLAPLTGAALLGFYLSLHAPTGRFLLSRLERPSRYRLIQRISEKLSRLYRSYLGFGERPGVLLLFLVLTAIEVSLPIVRSWITGLSLGVDVPLLYYFAFIPIILILIRLPISIDGFGLQEGGFVYFLGLVGISAGLAFSVGVINHLIFLLGLVPGGIFYALQRGTRAAVSDAEAEAAVRQTN